MHSPPPNVDAIRDALPRPSHDPWWVLRAPENRTLVGRLEAQLYLEPKFHGGDPRTVELTLHIDPDAQHGGYGTIALREVSAFLHGRSWHVLARIHHTNSKSEALAAKVGFHETQRWDDKGHAYWSYDPDA